MKKYLTLALVICIGVLSGNAFGQEKKTQDKKGGFSVGGYDNTRQEEKATVTKRSVVITEEEAPAEKAAEEAMPEPAPAPAMAPPAPPPPEAKPQEGKDAGQASSQDARDKQKPRKEKAKGKRR
jgi:hypothetical protein